MPNEDPTSGPLSDVFLEADPEMAAFMARHTALLERVTVLERAAEKAINSLDSSLKAGDSNINYYDVDDARLTLRDALNG